MEKILDIGRGSGKTSKIPTHNNNKKNAEWKIRILIERKVSWGKRTSPMQSDRTRGGMKFNRRM